MASCMVVCPHISEGSHRHFPIEDVLIDIGKYINCLKSVLEKQNKALEEKENRITELQKRNEHLNKAVNTLKDRTTLESQCSCKRRRTESIDAAPLTPQFDDDNITVLDDEDDHELCVSASLMDTALNETDLNTSTSFINLPLSSEVITATEAPQSFENPANVRQRFLQKNYKKSLLGFANNENRKPAPAPASRPTLSLKQSAANLSPARTSTVLNKKSSDWHSKDQRNAAFKNSQSSPSLLKAEISMTAKPSGSKLPKQSYLIRNGNQLKNTLGLSKISQKKPCTTKADEEDNENVFDFDATETFILDTTHAADKTNSFNKEMDIFSPKEDDYQSKSEPSVVVIPNPTQKPIIIEDTHIETTQEKLADDDVDSLADFEMPAVQEVNSLKPSPKIVLKTRTTTIKEDPNETSTSFLQPICSNSNVKEEQHNTINAKIKQEPSTSHSASTARLPINPIFQYTESSEEMDDDFEPELMDIDIEKLTCCECKKFLKFVGANMPLKRKQEYLSKCEENHHRIPDTPEGFWNPHLNSFSANDPRNETIIDKRWQQKRQQ